MGEFKKPTSEKDFDQNFAQLKPLMSSTEAYYESSRCLFCYDAPCIKACPTGIDIPLFIRQINSDNVIGAAKTIYEDNWMGNACGKVCPTEVLCEGACVYNHSDVKPIEIGRLQNFATQHAIASDRQLFHPKAPIGKKAAVIGAGPAGISCACELQLHGFEVEVFEAKAQPSGLTLYGVAPYKITNQEAIDEIDYLQKHLGFKVHYQSRIHNKKTLQQLEKDFDVIFLGIGLGETRTIRVPGEELENSVGATEFIEQLRMQQFNLTIPDDVVVLGGGNTAMDAASECARLGAKNVTLAYRRSKAEMGAYAFEYELAKSVGVKGLFNVTPIRLEGNRKVEKVKLVRTQSVDGRLEHIPDSAFEISCDMVIRATGQEKQKDFLSLIENLQTDEKGRIVVNEHFQTTNPKYFAAGDGVNGGAEVVNAAAEAKIAAQGIVSMVV